MAADHADDALI